MLQAARRSTIPLDRDATGRFLPFIIAIMVLLAFQPRPARHRTDHAAG